MSYRNFIPTVWAEAIQRELERKHIFAANTNRQYEGEVKKLGDSVRILGIAAPTITEYDLNSKNNQFNGLSAAETVDDTSTTLYIDKMATFNYKVDDIDERQAVGGVMEALSNETSEGLANVQDRAIAGLAFDTLAVNVNNSAVQLTASNILQQIMLGHQKLMENDVAAGTKVTCTITPAVATIYKDALGTRDTDNSELLKTGVIGYFDGVEIKVSNNVAHKTIGGKDVLGIQMKTDRAIAFANPMTHTEAYRPDLDFTDCVKGFTLYGTKIVRPKEMFILNGYL